MINDELGDMERKQAREEMLLARDAELEQMALQAVQRLYYWQQGGTNYTSLLYDLMVKADSDNFKKLATVYPMEANALIAWRTSPSQDTFFQTYGLGNRGNVHDLR